MTSEATIPRAQPAAQAPAKRLVLATLIGIYSTFRWLGGLFRRAVAIVRSACQYVRGVHLLVLEKMAGPVVETTRLVTLPAGNASYRMALVTPGLIEDHIVRYRSWEPHLMELMSILMPPDGVFIDIGANIGCHSLHLAARYPQARCHAFEPHPEIFRQLARNTRLSSLRNLTLNRHAVGGTSRQGAFYLQGSRSYNRGLSSATLQSDLKDDWQEAVIRFEPLDDVLSAEVRQSVSLIKIDTQGSERDALAGAQRTIAESRPAVILEFESRYHADPLAEIREILALLPGYEIFCLKPGSTDLRKFDAEAVRDARFEADLVCLPQ